MLAAVVVSTAGCVGVTDREDFDAIVDSRGGGLSSDLVLAAIVVWGIVALRLAQPIVLLQIGANIAGVALNHAVELGAAWLAFGPRAARLCAGALFVLFQLTLIASGNLCMFVSVP